METDCNPQYGGINLLGSSRAKMSCWVSRCMCTLYGMPSIIIISSMKKQLITLDFDAGIVV